MTPQETQPLISVLMTSYNREKYIAEAIESVLASTFTNFELIIVDDASTDNTVEIAKNFEKKDDRVKVYVNEKNVGQFPNRNKAAGYAKGKYIKYFDSDDKLYDWGLGYCVEMMEKYPDAGMAMYCNKKEINREYFTSHDAINTHFFETPILNQGPSSTILKKDAFEKNGRYNPNYGVPSDGFFNLEMASRFPVVLFKENFYFYRVHDNQEFNDKYSYLLNNYRFLSDALNLPDFPLNDFQKKEILSKAEKSFVMQFLVYIKNTGHILKALKAFSHSGIGVRGFWAGMIKNLRA